MKIFAVSTHAEAEVLKETWAISNTESLRVHVLPYPLFAYRETKDNKLETMTLQNAKCVADKAVLEALSFSDQPVFFLAPANYDGLLWHAHVAHGLDTDKITCNAEYKSYESLKDFVNSREFMEDSGIDVDLLRGTFNVYCYNFLTSMWFAKHVSKPFGKTVLGSQKHMIGLGAFRVLGAVISIFNPSEILSQYTVVTQDGRHSLKFSERIPAVCDSKHNQQIMTSGADVKALKPSTLNRDKITGSSAYKTACPSGLYIWALHSGVNPETIMALVHKGILCVGTDDVAAIAYRFQSSGDTSLMGIVQEIRTLDYEIGIEDTSGVSHETPVLADMSALRQDEQILYMQAYASSLHYMLKTPEHRRASRFVMTFENSGLCVSAETIQALGKGVRQDTGTFWPQSDWLDLIDHKYQTISDECFEAFASPAWLSGLSVSEVEYSNVGIENSPMAHASAVFQLLLTHHGQRYSYTAKMLRWLENHEMIQPSGSGFVPTHFGFAVFKALASCLDSNGLGRKIDTLQSSACVSDAHKSASRVSNCVPDLDELQVLWSQTQAVLVEAHEAVKSYQPPEVSSTSKSGKKIKYELCFDYSSRTAWFESRTGKRKPVWFRAGPVHFSAYPFIGSKLALFPSRTSGVTVVRCCVECGNPELHAHGIDDGTGVEATCSKCGHSQRVPMHLIPEVDIDG